MVFVTQFIAYNKSQGFVITLSVLGGLTLAKIAIGLGCVAAGAITGYVISEELKKSAAIQEHYAEIEAASEAVYQRGATAWKFSDDLLTDVQNELDNKFDEGENTYYYVTEIDYNYFRNSFRPSTITKAYTYYHNDFSYYLELFGEVGRKVPTTKSSTFTFKENLDDLYRVGNKEINDADWIAAKRVSYMTISPSNTSDKYYLVPVLSQRAKEHYNYYYPNDDISLENNPDVNMEYRKLNSLKVNGVENPIKIYTYDNYKYKIYEDTLGDGTITTQNTILSSDIATSTAYQFELSPEFNVFEDGRILVYAYYNQKGDTRVKSAYSKDISENIKTYTQQNNAIVTSVPIENTDIVTYYKPLDYPESIKLPNVEDTYDDLVGITPEDVTGDEFEIGNPPDTDSGVFVSIWEWLQSFWAKLTNALNNLNVRDLLTEIRDNTDTIAENTIPSGSSDGSDLDENVRKFSLPDLFILFLDVLLACIMLILRFITWLVTMPSIPATSELLSPEMVIAYDFARNQNIPVLNVSMFTLISLVFTFCFSLIIARKVKVFNRV